MTLCLTFSTPNNRRAQQYNEHKNTSSKQGAQQYKEQYKECSSKRSTTRSAAPQTTDERTKYWEHSRGGGNSHLQGTSCCCEEAQSHVNSRNHRKLHPTNNKSVTHTTFSPAQHIPTSTQLCSSLTTPTEKVGHTDLYQSSTVWAPQSIKTCQIPDKGFKGPKAYEQARAKHTRPRTIIGRAVWLRFNLASLHHSGEPWPEGASYNGHWGPSRQEHRFRCNTSALHALTSHGIPARSNTGKYKVDRGDGYIAHGSTDDYEKS